MPSLSDEIDHNYGIFRGDWKKGLKETMDALGDSEVVFSQSYKRLVSLQAWRSMVLEQKISSGSLAFFLEAQNDGLLSHVQASFGCWRIALKALRSCIENILMSLYYKDHPVELELWTNGAYRQGVAESMKYFEKHPLFVGLPKSLTGIDTVEKEYAALSKAVHGSSRRFRMTEDGKALSLWNSDTARLGQWKTRETRTLKGLNLMLVTMFREQLHGTRNQNLRRIIGFSVPSAQDNALKDKLSVHLLRN